MESSIHETAQKVAITNIMKNIGLIQEEKVYNLVQKSTSLCNSTGQHITKVENKTISHQKCFP
uniref:Uncharacterized protein n=1 Tax=Rhizophora mucronata TaxID=61149 RepID=A0A2P2LD34_RHIMU